MNASEMLLNLVGKEKVVQIEFKPQWRNGTGYFDGAVHEELVGEFGTVYTCTDEESRRVLLICKTQFGNVVIFQRYSDGDKGVVTGNFSTRLKAFLPSGAWSANDVEHWFAPWSTNIGETVEYLRKCFELDQKKADAASKAVE
jgi:hypothetical protein